MTLVLDQIRPAEGQVHALVIGAGEYTHLRQGRAAEFDLDPMLTSPPRSAAAFAQFLVDELRAPVPLGSVDLWLSGADSFTSTSTGRTTGIASPVMHDLSQAIADWAERSRSHEANVAFFYFCGHGIAKAGSVGLLASDCGSTPNPLLGAIDLTALQGAMANQPNPSQQVFIIDACREPSLQAMRQYGEVGVDVLGWETDVREAHDSAIFFATLPTSLSYGKTDDVSYFTQAVLRALRGLGAQYRGPERWEVSTDCLQRGIKAAMRADPEGVKLDQRPQLGGWTSDRVLHRLDDPGDIPLSISVPLAPVSWVEMRRGQSIVTRLEYSDKFRGALPVAEYVGNAQFAEDNWVLDEQPIHLWPPEADLVWEAQWQT